MSLLITGAAGFIGSNFVHEWSQSEAEPLVLLDKLTYAGNFNSIKSVVEEKSYPFIHGDISDAQFVDSLFDRYSPRCVINFAAESHVDRSIANSDVFINTNIVGTFTLLESARKYWIGMAPSEQSQFRFLHVSTDEVYGSLGANDPAFAEEHPYSPNSPYSATKAASDHLVRAWHQTYGLPVLTTNCSNNYGPYQFPEKLIPLVILNALAGKRLPVYGDGMQVRDWLYVGDHCVALRTVLKSGRLGEVYNIGGNSEKTNLDVIRSVCSVLDAVRPRVDGKSYSDQIEFVADRPGHDRRYAVDARKIAGELGWLPSESFDTGISKTVRWYLDNPAWVDKVCSGEYREWIDSQYGT